MDDVETAAVVADADAAAQVVQTAAAELTEAAAKVAAAAVVANGDAAAQVVRAAAAKAAAIVANADTIATALVAEAEAAGQTDRTTVAEAATIAAAKVTAAAEVAAAAAVADGDAAAQVVQTAAAKAVVVTATIAATRLAEAKPAEENVEAAAVVTAAAIAAATVADGDAAAQVVRAAAAKAAGVVTAAATIAAAKLTATAAGRIDPTLVAEAAAVVAAAAKAAATAVVADGDAAAQVVQNAAAKAATFILAAADKAAAERDRLEEHLRQTQKMEAVGQLAGGIAHDFNNLLTVISGFTELALAVPKCPPACHADLLEVQKAAEQAETLTRQLLAFSRRQVLQPRVIDVNALVAGIQNMLRRTVREDIEVVLALRSVNPVRMDAGQLQQVLMNLTVNARDAMPTGGQLRFATESVDVDEAFAREHPPMTPGRHVRLTVSDTGVGMPPETLAKLFEPFFTTKPVGKGTGLGLATVYGIVKQSGGFVWVESHVGRGTSFVIEFPAVDAPIDPQIPAPVTERMVNGSETVLLVEDESPLRRLVKQVLRDHGYAVLEGRDGNQGLEVAQQHRAPIHLLLTDVVMPGMSGPDLASRLLSTRPEMRVLYMSGYVDTDHVAAIGTAPLLIKPFLPGALLRHVRDVLDATSAS